MPFNSITFALFFLIVFIIYWLLQRKDLAFQNIFLLIASYFFYACWDYRFLALLLFISLVNYIIALSLWQTEDVKRRRLLLILSLLINIGILCLFKYLGFFVTSFAVLLGKLGVQVNGTALRIILPLGISYYTLQVVGYVIDVYRRNFKPTYNPLNFFLFVAFFPKLTAGPIERASNLLIQVENRRTFQVDRAKDGLRQMLSGLLKKIVIADNLEVHVQYIFGHYATLDGTTLLTGAFLFAIQIYCDFSGYSDLALGSARLLGFELMPNFAYPYFSKSIAEFWRRWHISLSFWFRDYVFFPLGGLGRSKVYALRNVLLTFALSGLWHGANWTFVAWGTLHGLYFFPRIILGQRLFSRASPPSKGLLPTFRELRQMMGTFLLVLFAWIFFRSNSLSQAFAFIERMFTHPVAGLYSRRYVPWVAASFFLLVLEWLQRRKLHPLDISNLPVGWRWLIYYLILVTLFWYGYAGETPFLYFRF